MHEVLVNRLGGLSLPRKSVVRLTDRPDMTLDVYRGRKTTMQQNATRRGNRDKLGIIFLFLHENIPCDPSLELSHHQDSSNEGSQDMFSLRNKKNYL